MSTVDKARLREMAEKATKGPWWVDSHGHRMSANGGMDTVFVADDRMGEAVRHPDTGNLSHWPNDWDASFIATANPATILALLDEIEALRKDAELYRALRAMHWHDGPLAVVRNPKDSVLLGSECPSGERLDEAIMEATPGAIPLEQPTT